MTDNLAGQLWFGAECLAAGSSIMHKERESDSMRPLAKAVTKSLEKVGSKGLRQSRPRRRDISAKLGDILCLTFPRLASALAGPIN